MTLHCDCAMCVVWSCLHARKRPLKALRFSPVQYYITMLSGEAVRRRRGPPRPQQRPVAVVVVAGNTTSRTGQDVPFESYGGMAGITRAKSERIRGVNGGPRLEPPVGCRRDHFLPPRVYKAGWQTAVAFQTSSGSGSSNKTRHTSLQQFLTLVRLPPNPPKTNSQDLST